MSKFLLFAWASGSPKGGWADYCGGADTFGGIVSHAKAIAAEADALGLTCDVFQCHESETGETYRLTLKETLDTAPITEDEEVEDAP